ncbi:TM2 domain-containing protein [Thermosynechococcus sp. B3]|uniref:TM2 domain-containing protein n=1 Tax=unclassified Thermosynechococcus TaxID=2622553 RepID=UPI0025780BFC|nr:MULTISPECIES: TM2 domain-containing protein [unclassified Thermosynechococcus]WJI26011.1 TM2 domain-containing protein [Thermosynechococcus sp. B1]WJI28540.1 TM2 domain-containing protein [Thermosynechococcus sp. B3]
MVQTFHFSTHRQRWQTQPKFLRVGVAYLLWCLSFVGFCGLQRFYVGQPMIGFLYLITFGFCGIGQFIDLFLIPGMVDHRNTYLRGRYLTAWEQADLNPATPMHRLLQVAKEHGGVLSAAQAALYTHFDAQTVEELLFEAQRLGYATVFNDPETGAVRYRFDV